MPIENKIGLLERFAENNSEILPKEWLNVLDSSFGVNWKLHDFQEKSLINALTVLYYFFNKDELLKKHLDKHFESLHKKDKEDINKTFESYKNNIIKELQHPFEFTPEYQNDIHPLFFRQMCFWMATGSGKTLIIIKIIEILAKLMKNKALDNKNILISSANDSIITQIKDHIAIYNRKSDIEIEFVPLKKFDKNQADLGYNRIKVFYTTTSSLAHEDQVSKKNKDGKRINYESVYNDGNWYVLLDEAHKGTEDSKAQAYFQLLASNGFLFNFSATFTESIRKLSTVYNMNLDKFINAGYGKQIKVIGEGFNTRSDEEENKQISILQSLLLLTAQKISKDEYLKDYYHNPLLLVFANSINSTISKDEKSDLKEFFRVLHDIINGKVSKDIFDEAKRLLLQEIRNNNQELGYTIGGQSSRVLSDFIRKISTNEIAEYILYNPKKSKLQSVLEFYKIGKDGSEVAIKLKTANQAFALLKFTDAHKWIEEVLPEAEELKTFDEAKNFTMLNNSENPYTMLLGSRMFVEGWDSNRPNLIHFIGLGQNDENTKLVLQAIGRGVRIEPINNIRKRNDYISADKKINVNSLSNTHSLFKDNYEPIILLETLFIFATNQKTMANILASLKNEKEDKEFKLIADHISPTKITEKPLLVPEYDSILEVNKIYEITQKQLDNITNFLERRKKVFLLKDISTIPSYIEKYLEICNYIISKKKIKIVPSHSFQELFDEDLLTHILEFFTGEIPKFKEFRELADSDITHYKYISVQEENDNIYNELIKEISKVMKSETLTKEELEKQLQDEFEQGKIDLSQVMRRTAEFTENSSYTSDSIKKIEKQYYQPTVYSGFDYTFKNAIDVDSEISFVNELCEFIKNGVSPNIIWWYFAKINQHHDRIYIPYSDKTYKQKYFYPDFIFWIKYKDKYKIVFVDPKGLGRQENPKDKLVGFNNIFSQKSYTFNTEAKIEIELFYYNNEYSTDSELEKHRIDKNGFNKIFR